MNETIIEFNSKKYLLTQDAYISDDEQQYKASSVRADDKEIKAVVFWDVTIDDPKNCDDESNMCDWDKPSDVIEY